MAGRPPLVKNTNGYELPPGSLPVAGKIGDIFAENYFLLGASNPQQSTFSSLPVGVADGTLVWCTDVYKINELTPTGDLLYCFGGQWFFVNTDLVADTNQRTYPLPRGGKWNDAPTVFTADPNNDEFDSSILDPSWTVNVNTAPSYDVNTTLPSCLVIKSGTETGKAFDMSKPFDPASGDFSVWCSISAALVTNYASFAMYLSNGIAFGGTGCNAWQIEMQQNSNIRATTSKCVNGTITYNVHNFFAPYNPCCKVDLLIQRVGGTWQAFCSFDGGGSWLTLTRDMGFAPTINTFGITFGNDAMTTPQMTVIDWIRFNQFFHP